jgi:hypothetical protein
LALQKAIHYPIANLCLGIIADAVRGNSDRLLIFCDPLSLGIFTLLPLQRLELLEVPLVKDIGRQGNQFVVRVAKFDLVPVVLLVCVGDGARPKLLFLGQTGFFLAETG